MNLKKLLALGLSLSCACSFLTGCGSGDTVDSGSGQASGAAAQVVLYSNADDEAVTAMTNALDAGGYQGQYLVQTLGTSELGGKLLAEGADIEADLVTMSTFYVVSAQEQNQMFLPLDFEVKTLAEAADYTAPITSQEGAIIVNTELLAQENLPMPKSLKDLGDPVYSGQLAVTDIQSSSTAWLLIQALADSYGEDGARKVLSAIYQNAGDHIETSGSAPLKLCRAGEVAVGFGLRHQAVADKASGLPIDFVDPAEGNFSLTESVAVIDKGDQTNPLAMEMAQCIIENARAELIQTYPNPLYAGEAADPANQSAHPMTFPEPLTFELFQQHQALSESAKP
ncbi:extracellular solute-binding protein [Agathobaculum sp.]|uniref:extracellular solute-binding protein n=1 Tax=Agathobaculum sp. TaxID=2048138 RepID=UPI002A7F7CE1|nr:extracellular solute-binding protein [Agathobaculum sp.]MDY3619466.1 extracellular solute-binding protein [Agathobaculum sp.]